MLVAYQLPQSGILIIPQMVSKEREEKKKEKTRGKAFPTVLSFCN
jgi:hypothetical protein